jgi:Mce-associated membrane protein
VAVAAAALIVVAVTTLPDAGAAGSTGPAAAASGATTALNQGSQIAVDFTSFDYKTLSQDQAQIATHLTPTFRKAYLTQSQPLNSVIRKAKSVASSRVVASGLSSYDQTAGTATVIVAVDVTSRNVQTQGTVQYYRFSVQLQRQGNEWLASNVIQE